jgi:hypothetical protein
MSYSLLHDGRETCLLSTDALFADGLTDVEQLLGPQEGAHVLGAERSHDGRGK